MMVHTVALLIGRLYGREPEAAQRRLRGLM